jgi:hypothetical protein
MIRAYDVATVRAAEEAAMAALPPGALMQRAAAGLATVVLDELRASRGRVYGGRVLLLVGAGSNGGDALWAGARLLRRGVRVDAVLVADRAHREGLAAFTAAGGRSYDASSASLGAPATHLPSRGHPASESPARPCSARAVSSSRRHERTFGRRLSRARRSRSVMPPQTPNSMRSSSASARHSVRTAQPKQTALARFCSAPWTNRSSGSPDAHAPRWAQSCTQPAVSAGMVISISVFAICRTAGLIADTMLSTPRNDARDHRDSRLSPDPAIPIDSMTSHLRNDWHRCDGATS